MWKCSCSFVCIFNCELFDITTLRLNVLTVTLDGKSSQILSLKINLNPINVYCYQPDNYPYKQIKILHLSRYKITFCIKYSSFYWILFWSIRITIHTQNEYYDTINAGLRHFASVDNHFLQRLSSITNTSQVILNIIIFYIIFRLKKRNME